MEKQIAVTFRIMEIGKPVPPDTDDDPILLIVFTKKLTVFAKSILSGEYIERFYLQV